MRFLGLDYGEKRIGCAVSDERATIAFPRETLRNDSLLMERIAGIIDTEKIGTIVVGDTRAFGGVENPITEAADAFMERLREETGLPVESIWEADTSIIAAEASDTGAHDDARAASVILQRYLDMKVRRVE